MHPLHTSMRLPSHIGQVVLASSMPVPVQCLHMRRPPVPAAAATGTARGVLAQGRLLPGKECGEKGKDLNSEDHLARAGHVLAAGQRRQALLYLPNTLVGLGAFVALAPLLYDKRVKLFPAGRLGHR